LRKISSRHRRLLIKRAVEGNRRRLRRSAGALGGKASRELARAAFNRWRKTLPAPQDHQYPDQKLRILTPPTVLSIVDHYETTLSFMLAIRDAASRKTNSISRFNRWRGLIDLAKIQDIDPATGLILAAELDRWRSRSLTSYEETWHENVRQFFSDAGLFDLLGLKPKDIHSKAAAAPRRQMLKYRRGTQPDGRQADQLRADLVALVGAPFGPRVPINNALAEAMTNSYHHAYPEGEPWWPPRREREWWATGGWTPTTGTIQLILYDRGVGIPRTLPRSKHWSTAIPVLDRLDPERSDAGLIEAALELRRTSTAVPGRGRGLYEMAEWIDQSGTGFLRIISGKGMVVYRPGGAKERRILPAAFSGTLVEWEVNVG
jgi:hypothetical protein